MKIFFALVLATLVSTKAYAGLIEASFSIWNTLSNSSTFVSPNAAGVSEPINLLILMLSALGLVGSRRVKS